MKIINVTVYVDDVDVGGAPGINISMVEGFQDLLDRAAAPDLIRAIRENLGKVLEKSEKWGAGP